MVTFQRNNLIDLLRFVAAISVALFHFYAIPDRKLDSWYQAVLSYGHIGVPIFFVISGYCIIIALESSKTPLEFIIRRFFRIFPPYWFSLLFTISVILFFWALEGVNSLATIPKSLTEIFATLILLTEPITKVKNINWVYWSLPYEIFFYIVIYICAHFRGNWFTIVLIIVSLISCLLPVTYHGFLSYFRFWPFFCLGASLYKLLHNTPKGRLLDMILMLLALTGFYRMHESLLYSVVSISVVLLIVYSHFKPLKQTSLTKLGDLSYSIYLIHIPIGIYCFHRFRGKKPFQGDSFLNFVLDVILITLIVYLSKIIHRYIEVPFIKMGKHISNNQKSD